MDVQQLPDGVVEDGSGARLWRKVLEEYDLEEHEMGLLVELCRLRDRLDALDVVIRAEGVMLNGPQGRRAHPAVVEVRQQGIAYARLTSALRLPAGEEEDQAEGRRPQRRTGVRGVYGITGGVAS